MEDRDTYDVEVRGTTREELCSQALDLASKYFELEVEMLEVLPFMAQPSSITNYTDGSIMHSKQVTAYVTVAIKDNTKYASKDGKTMVIEERKVP